MEGLHQLVKRIDAFSEWVGQTMSWLTLLMALVTFVIVVLRYVFNVGWIWMQESVVYMHGLVFMLTAGYTLLHDGHVRVDIFYRPLSPQKKAWVDLLGTLLLLFPTCGLILYFGTPYVERSWSVFEGSKEAGGIPGVFLLKTAILLFPILIGIQGLSQVLRSVLVIKGYPIESVKTESHPE